jgi:hypothetical protein
MERSIILDLHFHGLFLIKFSFIDTCLFKGSKFCVQNTQLCLVLHRHETVGEKSPNEVYNPITLGGTRCLISW